MKINKHIQFVCRFGALDSSKSSIEARNSFEVLSKHYSHVSVAEISNFQDLQRVVDSKPDLVFLGAAPKKFVWEYADRVQEVWLAEFFELNQIPYTGSGPVSMNLEANKQHAKAAIRDASLLTGDYFLASDSNEFTNEEQLPVGFPLFLKPTSLGNGRGISEGSVVRDFWSFKERLDSVVEEFKTEVIAEKYLFGREFTVAVLESEFDSESMAMPLELIAEANENGDRILGNGVKRADKEEATTVENQELNNELKAFALKSFEALHGRDYGRIDIRMDDFGRLHFLEANLRPGLGGGYFTRACWMNQHIDYEEMILSIVNLALRRCVGVRDEVVVTGAKR